jgi:hypothetical protein
MNIFGDEIMHCRHCGTLWEVGGWEYCPECHRNSGGAVYPATQTEQELRDIDILIQQIHTAFADVTLDGAETLHQADLEGAYRDIQVWHDAGKKDLESHWTEVPDWKLEWRWSVLSFLKPESWRFYIPAFMCWSLKNWRTSDSVTSDRVLSNLGWVGEDSTRNQETLNRVQAEAVYAFLSFFNRYSGEPDAAKAIQANWSRFQPDPPDRCEAREPAPESSTQDNRG